MFRAENGGYGRRSYIFGIGFECNYALLIAPGVVLNVFASGFYKSVFTYICVDVIIVPPPISYIAS